MKQQNLSHADCRAQLDALMQAYTGPIRRVDTMVDVNCPTCDNHWKVRMAQLGQVQPVCSKCGNRNPIIAQRDSLRRWARQRRTR
jgi:hypothetical protein